MVLPCWQRRWQRRRWRARGQQEPLCRCRVGRQRLSWRELRAVHIYQVGPGCRLQVAGCRMQVTVWCGERDGGGKGEPGPHPTRTRQRPTEAVRGSTLVQTTGCRCHSGARARTWGPPAARPDRLPEPRRIAAHLVSGEKSRSPDVSVQCPHLAKLRLDMSRRLHCTALHCTMDALAQLDMSSATATACSHSRQHPTRTLILMLMLMLMLPPPPCA